MSRLFKKGLFLNLTSYNKDKWEEYINFLNKFNGLDFIEIWLEENDLNIREIEWIKKKLSNYEIIIHAPFINLTLISTHKEVNKASINILKKTIDIAVRLRSKVVTIHAGSYPLFLSKNEVRKTFIENFQQIIKYAANKMSIAIENVSLKKTTQISYPVLLNELSKIKSFIPDINFTIDVGHCVQNNDSFLKFLKNNKNSIKNIHLHNAIKNGQAHFGFQKKGDLNLEEFIIFLKKINYNNFLSLEILEKEDIKNSWDLLLKNLS